MSTQVKILAWSPEEGAEWEVQASPSVLFWVACALSRYPGATIAPECDMHLDRMKAFKDLDDEPSFWPASKTTLPLNWSVEESSSNGSGYKSQEQECQAAWHEARKQVLGRTQWMRQRGAHPCIENMLLMPFATISAKIRMPLDIGIFDFVSELVDGTENIPEVRLLGYRMAESITATHKEFEMWFGPLLSDAPEWVCRYLKIKQFPKT